METITETHAEKEDRDSFHRRITCFTEHEFELIDFAYDLAKEAHRGQIRKDGERYFEHARAVALILMDECKIMDVNMIITTLLHDTVEDSPLFCNATKAHSVWKQKAFFSTQSRL
jgi:(p)ppGpp synthase/HD superfamily hydrolase